MRLKNVDLIRLAIPIVLAIGVTTPGLVAQSGPVILTSPVETPGQFSYGSLILPLRTTASGSRSTSIATRNAPSWLVSTYSCS